MINPEETPAYRWVVLGSFTFGYSVVIVAVASLGLLLPEISDELSLSPSQQGWLGSSVLFGNVLFSIPINWWLSRYRPWFTAGISFLAGTLLIGLIGWAPTFAVLLLARLGLGIVQQATQAPRTLVIIEWMSRRQFGTANGVSIAFVDVLMGIGFIMIPLVMGWVGGWRNTQYTWASVCLVASVLWIVLGRERATSDSREETRAQDYTPLITLLKYREVWLMSLAVFGVMIARMAFNNFWPTFVQDEFGIKITMAGFVIGAASLAMAPSELGLVVIPFFNRRKPAVLFLCGVVQCLSYVGLLSTSSVPLLFLLAIVNGAAFGFFPILLTMLFELPGIKPREVAIASSFVYTVLWGGGAVGPLLVGFVQEATDSLKLGLLISSLMPITLALAGLLLSGQARKAIPAAVRPSEGGAGQALSEVTEGREGTVAVPAGKRK